jgi:hypothetical protein
VAKTNHEIRQDTAALVIDECKRFILELRRDWENKRELVEQGKKPIAESNKQTEKILDI